MLFTEKLLNQKRVQNLANKLNLEVFTGLDSTTDSDDITSLEVAFTFNEDKLKDSQTVDDIVVYRLTSIGLEFSYSYQIDNIVFPKLILTKEQLKNFMIDLSNSAE